MEGWHKECLDDSNLVASRLLHSCKDPVSKLYTFPVDATDVMQTGLFVPYIKLIMVNLKLKKVEAVFLAAIAVPVRNFVTPS